MRLVVEGAADTEVTAVGSVGRLPEVGRETVGMGFVPLLRGVPSPAEVAVEQPGGHGVDQQRRRRRLAAPVLATAGVFGGGRPWPYDSF